MSDSLTQLSTQASSSQMAEDATTNQDADQNSSRADQFLVIFNRIERIITQLYGDGKYLGFKRMVEKVSQEHAVIAQYKFDLIEYVQLRNALVHKSTGKPIAEPYPEVLEAITQLYEQLDNPQKAMSIAASPVFTCTTSDSVAEVIQTMQRNFYSVVPVYHDNRFVGVFSDHSLTKWLGSESGSDALVLQEKTIGQLQDFFDQEDDKSSAYRFVGKNADVYEVRQDFVSFLEDKKRLVAVFVTSNGDKQQKIEGIITAWDLPKISKMVKGSR